MKKRNILATFLILTFLGVNAQTGPYYWQVTSINSISGGATYNVNDMPSAIVLNINQCAGGNVQPHNSTSYTLSWYVNSTNSNIGGTLVSSSTMQTTNNFNPTLNFTPPTNMLGTFYYYAEFSNPSMTTCGFTTPLTSPAEQVIINCGNPATGTDTRTECNSYTWIDGNNYTTSNNSATFNIIGGAASGCDSTVTLNLTINNVSDLTTSISNETISSNNTNASFQWINCADNSVIAGETNSSFTATTNGNYAVVISENGCQDTSACVIIESVGIIENNFGDELKVYPNPTNGNFSIDLGAVYESSIISITDLSGKLIESKTMSQSQMLNLFINEPSGIYILSIQAGNEKALVRLVKE